MSDRPRSRATVRYAFDDANRLIVRDRSPASQRLRPVRIIDGEVTTDSHNHLVYHSASGFDGSTEPRILNLDGTWRLTRQHELALALHESEERERRTLFLKGAVVEARADALVFALRRSEDDDLRTGQRLTLSGRWRADAKNRLGFLVEKADGSEDRLTLQGGWGVGPHHELLYRYQQPGPDGRLRPAHTLIFEGAWDISRSDRIIYRLAGSSESAFEFRAGLQSPSLLARDGRIAYQVGIGLSGGRVQPQRVTLFGAWKLNRDFSVSFEVPYADGRVQAIRFEGEARLSARDRIAVALFNNERQGLGLTVTFTRELFPDASLFLQLRKSAEERAALGGIHVRF